MIFNPEAGFRSDVTLPDVPLTWRTNLTDDEIREVYRILLAKRFFIREPELKKPNIETGQGLTMGLGETTDLEYKGRMCV